LDEPDRVENLLRKYSKVAAFIWGEAQRAADSKQVNCPSCIVVAGEFAAYQSHHGYVEAYEQTIVDNERKHDAFPTEKKPTFWGMHDYNDLEDVRAEESDHGKDVIAKNYVNSEKRAFVHRIEAKGRGSRHVWLTEQGVRIETTSVTGTTKLTGNTELQRLAAQDFLRLGSPGTGVERVFYYEYKGPSKVEKERLAAEVPQEHPFDSALLAGEGYGPEPADFRPAYCVLALAEDEGCAEPKVTTKAPVPGTTTGESSTVLFTLAPEGIPTSYWIEYGTSSEYGQVTEHVQAATTEGEASETVALSGLQPCTTYHYQAEAENEDDRTAPSLGGDQTFTTLPPFHGQLGAIAMGPDGDLYIGDQEKHEVLKWKPGTCSLSVVAGNAQAGYSGDGGPATEAELGGIYSLAFNAEGDLYIGTDDVMREVDTAGVISTVAGDGSPGIDQGNGEPATSVDINTPGSISVTESGEIALCRRVRRRAAHQSRRHPLDARGR
jgi:hypothetical protein